jgi:ATP-dependent helicase Lhr and Lhr-like helicase
MKAKKRAAPPETFILRHLHPSLAAWFEATYKTFSEIQLSTLPHTLGGDNTLVLAPTGSGKTFAGFLSVLSQMADAASKGELGNAINAVYISPLKALDNDIHRNLLPALEAINRALPMDRQIRMDVRTGDTAPDARSRQQRTRPHLLLTTPETLSSLLSQTQWREHGFAARSVIVDEIHSFAENKRGSLLSLCLERLEAQDERPLQRIGISATAWPVEAIQKLLCGKRSCAVARADLKKAHQLSIAAPDPGAWLPPAGYNPYRIAPTVAQQVEKVNCSLIFLTTRSGVERLALALKILMPEWDERIAVHHGSVERETRLDIEQGLKDGYWKAVVASSSLELGVDFASVDQVLLIGTPRGVSRGLQRLGRSGHRVDGVAKGSLVPLSLPDLVECVALREAVQAGRLDALRIPGAPLDVLAQTLLGMSIEREWGFDEAFHLIRKAGPYEDLSHDDFNSILSYLAGHGRVLGGYGTYGKTVIEGDKFRVASRKVAREYYLNLGVISDDFQMKIVTQKNRWLGEIEEGFISSLQPNEAFIFGGKCLRIVRVHQNTAVVEAAQGENVKTPRWMGNKMPLTAQLAEEELGLRRSLRDAWARGGVKACERLLTTDYGADANVANRIAGFVQRQCRAMPLPADSPVLAETVKSGRTVLMLVHVVAGRAVNRSLAWVTGARLAGSRSVVANFDDHGFLLSLDARTEITPEKLRSAFSPQNWMEDLRRTLTTTDSLGRMFRRIAEIGQLLPRRTLRGNVSVRMASWNGDLLYKTLLEYEPDHPLVREAVREVLEDQCDAPRALEESRRIFESPIELYNLPRPSPFALPLFSAFNREVLMASDPDRALDDLVNSIYEGWAEE